MFSTSIHELTACIYYKLAIERGMRGCHVDDEDVAHKYAPLSYLALSPFI